MPAPKKPPQKIGVIVTQEELRRVEAKTGQKSPFQIFPKQAYLITRTEHLIGVGGGKFSGKSQAGIFWMISGNKHAYTCPRLHKKGDCDCGFPDNDKDGKPIPVNRSYVYHPKFLGCVLRENAIDLRDWIREAESIYKIAGGVFNVGDREFVFPSGAKIFCGHYQDEDAFTKYAGLNITRFLVEEATHIPNVRHRLRMLRSICRSVYPEMRAQVLCTFNPGGVSHADILDLFVEPKDEHGVIIPPGTTITDEYDAEEIYRRLGVPKPAGVGDKIISTRVFVFMTIKDNPAALANQEYIGALMDLPEEEREAYLFGNWHVLAGEFFKSFRPKGPQKGEPPEANHVVPFNILQSRIKPWWWRTMAMDYGYSHDCVTLWGCHDPERDQFWVTDEMAVNQTEPDIIGEEIARRSIKILEGLESPMIVMGLSHDAYGLRQDDRSVAELIARGISRILGPNMVHLPDLQVDRLKDEMEQEGKSTGTNEAEAIFDRIRGQQHMGITIRRMRESRIVGWQLIRTMMRWKTTLPDIKDIFDPNLASRIAYERGLEAYGAYTNLFKKKQEILPKMQIVGPPIAADGKIVQGTGLGCAGLINAIPKAIRDDRNPEDVTTKHVQGASDYWDCLRYLVLSFRGQSLPEPFSAKRERIVNEVRAVNPNVDTSDLIQINRRLESAEKARKGGPPIHVIRPARLARARAKGLIGGI
ncbi:MAG TPA: hypothetical protein VNH83_11915, partial [Bryobacteraceae bacterium]|nr:hypothetical protein [Bryobacteraceae bacterium]